jgi:hypothetical protein
MTRRLDDPARPPPDRPDRRTREAEALRANLARRKAQQRARRDQPGPDGEAGAGRDDNPGSDTGRP